VLASEDITIFESVQRGLGSRGYTTGRYVHAPEGGQKTEAAVDHFHRLYAAAIEFQSGCGRLFFRLMEQGMPFWSSRRR